MFRLFRKKSERERLDEKYRKLLKEAHSLYKINRKAGDKKMSEANRLIIELENLEPA